MVTTHIDPYEVLGVSPAAEPEAVQAAYRALARKYHPDRNPAGEARMKALTEAFAILSDPARRAEYDGRRTRPESASPADSTARATATSGAPAAATRRCRVCGDPGGDELRRRHGRCHRCRAVQLERRLALTVGLWLVALALWHFGAGSPPLLAMLLAYPPAAFPTTLRAAAWVGDRVLLLFIASWVPRGHSWWIATLLWAIRGLVLWAVGLVICPIEMLLGATWLVSQVRAIGAVPPPFGGRGGSRNGTTARGGRP